MIADMEVLVCATTQIIADKKEPTNPTAAKASTELCFKLPTIAMSVKDRIDSDIPAKIAGMANLLMSLKLMELVMVIFLTNAKVA